MDVVFEIIIPNETVIPELDFKIPYYEWDGIEYEQGPPECLFHSNYMLQILEVIGKHRLPEKYKNLSLKSIYITGDGLRFFVEGLFGFRDDLETQRAILVDLLSIITKSSSIWTVFFTHSDNFTHPENNRKGSLDDVINNIENSFKTTHYSFVVFS